MDYFQLVTDLQSGAYKHDKALTMLYNDRSLKNRLVSQWIKKGIQIQDTESLWTDLVIQFSQLVQKGKYTHENKLQAYLSNLGNYLALNHFRSLRTKKTEAIDGVQIQSEFTELNLFNDELKKLLDQQLNRLGSSCKKILSFWAGGYSMKEIQKKLGLISPEATRKRKHKCMQTLLLNVRNNENLMTRLKDYLK